MKNIKLYDLQEGKYLELGKDFLYGGVGILVSKIKLDFPLPMYLFNAVKSDYDWLNNAQTQPVNISDIATFETIRGLIQEPLKTLCEKTGAVVYGGRYVLLNNEKCGNIYCEQNKWGTVHYLNKNIYSFMPCLEFNLENDKKQTVARFFSLDNCQDNVIGNIFEEYSKSLRGEENELNKLMELFK